MDKIVLVLALLLAPLSLGAQTMNNDDLGRRLGELEDRAALKALVDTFSILADQKDVQAQTLLFTEDATTETWRGDARVSELRGRAAMGAAFGAFLANFQTVYHFNGQQTLTLDGDRATGTSYCLVTLIGDEGGRRMQTTIGVIYNDDYVRENGRWLIARRRSVFDWEEKREVSR
jgi:ketosteroid isomerase-like protein